MLLYTSILVVSFLVAVPIIILIYESIVLANQTTSDFSYDEAITTTGRASGQKYRVKLNVAKARTSSIQAAFKVPLEERYASADWSGKAGVKEGQEKVTLESVCKPFKRKASANTVNSETMKKPITRELAPKTLNPGTVSKPFSKSMSAMALNTETVNPGTVSKPLSKSMSAMALNTGTVNTGAVSKPISQGLAPVIPNTENSGRPWGW